MVSALDSGASAPGSSPSLGHCVVFLGKTLGTFRSEDEDDYEYEFPVLSTRTSKNVGLQTLCACSVWKTRTRSGPRPPI